MENNFFKSRRKQIPNNLDDCLKTDSTSYDLWTVAGIIETWGKILFIVLIVIGIIGTIITTAIIGNLEETLSFPAFMISIIIWGFAVFVEYCIYHLLALSYSATASIVQNTRVTADIALFQSTKSNLSPTYAHTQNANNTQGFENSNNTLNNVFQSDTWTCLHCGTMNKKDYGHCKKCGKYRSH